MVGLWQVGGNIRVPQSCIHRCCDSATLMLTRTQQGPGKQRLEVDQKNHLQLPNSCLLLPPPAIR